MVTLPSPSKNALASFLLIGNVRVGLFKEENGTSYKLVVEQSIQHKSESSKHPQFSPLKHNLETFYLLNPELPKPGSNHSPGC
jgi:hypothetical protein